MSGSGSATAEGGVVASDQPGHELVQLLAPLADRKALSSAAAGALGERRDLDVTLRSSPCTTAAAELRGTR